MGIFCGCRFSIFYRSNNSLSAIFAENIVCVLFTEIIFCLHPINSISNLYALFYLVYQGHFTSLEIPENNDFCKSAFKPVNTVLYPCETVAARRDRKSVFNAAFCKRQAVNLSLGDDCCFILGVALIHTEQNRHTVLFTPFLVFINTFDKFAVAIFYKLQDIVFIVEREHNNIGIIRLCRYVILSAYLFGYSSACHILNG